MDGGRRLLRSLSDWGARLAPAPLAFAGAPDPFPAKQDPFPTKQDLAPLKYDPFAFPKLPQTAPRVPERRARPTILRVLHRRIARSRFLGTWLVLGFFSTAIAFGMVRGGEYAQFVDTYGRLPDIIAKTSGFAIKAVTITGTKELTEAEILAFAGVSSRNSLIFLDVSDVRARLTAVPLIKDASVSKLYPNRLVIEIEERLPSALWQMDGAVHLVAADGQIIDDLHDARFEHLPLVVGAGANGQLTGYQAILDAAGELRERIRAGIFVSGRRWTLRTDSNIDIDLPETGAADAVVRFAKLEHDSHILEKDILSVDLRIPGRVVARLSEDAAATRAELLAKKTKKKGATT